MAEMTHWRQLADQGDAEAQYKIGMMYENGLLGVEKNLAEAFFWYWLAATKPSMRKVHTVGKRLTNEQIRAAQERALAWKPSPTLSK